MATFAVSTSLAAVAADTFAAFAFATDGHQVTAADNAVASILSKPASTTAIAARLAKTTTTVATSTAAATIAIATFGSTMCAR